MDTLTPPTHASTTVSIRTSDPGVRVVRQSLGHGDIVHLYIGDVLLALPPSLSNEDKATFLGLLAREAREAGAALARTAVGA